MVEIASRAKRDFTFYLIGAEAVGAVNLASAEAEIYLILGGANGIDMVFFALL